MSTDISTHLQALYHSGQISGYIHSKLPDGPLKTGWIEQGIVSKGMKGNLRDKNNQESLVIPADRFARLARDRDDWHHISLFILGSKGLSERKFISVVFGPKESQSLITFQTQKFTPYDIIRLLLHIILGRKLNDSFEEPNLDYIEQLRMDASEDELDEMMVLSLPKKHDKISEWMKEVLLNPSSDNVELQHGSSKKIPKFGALITRWLTGLELFKSISNAIATMVFINRNSMDTCFWDQSQRIVAFTTFSNNNLDALARKYLTPLWLVPGESVVIDKPSRKESGETPKVTVSPAKQTSPKKSERLIPSEKSESDTALAKLKHRLDSLELQLQSSLSDSVGIEKDRGVMEVLQSRLAENIERIESLTKRLIELEKRLHRLRT